MKNRTLKMICLSFLMICIILTSTIVQSKIYIVRYHFVSLKTNIAKMQNPMTLRSWKKTEIKTNAWEQNSGAEDEELWCARMHSLSFSHLLHNNTQRGSKNRQARGVGVRWRSRRRAWRAKSRQATGLIRGQSVVVRAACDSLRSRAF